MGEVISYTKTGIDALIAAALSGAATQADIDAAIAALVDTSPAALDTLNELAAALGDDANFAATVTTSLAAKQDAATAATQAELDAVQTNAMGVVIHGATASTARPSGYGSIHWIGSVSPTNAIDNDVWTDTSA